MGLPTTYTHFVLRPLIITYANLPTRTGTSLELCHSILIPTLTVCKVPQSRSILFTSATMEVTALPVQSVLLGLELLESDPTPLFIIRVGRDALAFDILYSNQTFREQGLRDVVLASRPDALLFRSWAQAIGHAVKHHYDFAGTRWTTEVAGTGVPMKVVRATGFLSQEQCSQHGSAPRRVLEQIPDSLESTACSVCTRSEEVDTDGAALLRKMPHTNLPARWEGIQTMMEMSDVGVFEYNTEGQLLHANEAWYRLRQGYSAHTWCPSCLREPAHIPEIVLAMPTSYSWIWFTPRTKHW